jgi:hypothetical protein
LNSRRRVNSTVVSTLLFEKKDKPAQDLSLVQDARLVPGTSVARWDLPRLLVSLNSKNNSALPSGATQHIVAREPRLRVSQEAFVI